MEPQLIKKKFCCLSFLICEVGFLWPVHRAWGTEGSQAYSNSPNELTLPHIVHDFANILFNPHCGIDYFYPIYQQED